MNHKHCEFLTDEDKQLLADAAFAAGITLIYWQGQPHRRIQNPSLFKSDSKPWNPLEDDGDAFRLMVALSIVWNPLGDAATMRREVVCQAARVGRRMAPTATFDL